MAKAYKVAPFVIGSLVAGLLGAAAAVPAGEFPDGWTADERPELRQAHAKLEGKPMPPLDVTGWINGEVKPADMKGKVVVVDFYATWCDPCLEAIPHNNALLKKYKDKGLVLIGVCTSNDGQDRMEKVVKERGIEFPTARDPNLDTEWTWKIESYPTYAVVDRKGIVRVVGLQPDRLEEVVKKLLDEK